MMITPPLSTPIAKNHPVIHCLAQIWPTRTCTSGLIGYEATCNSASLLDCADRSARSASPRSNQYPAVSRPSWDSAFTHTHTHTHITAGRAGFPHALPIRMSCCPSCQRHLGANSEVDNRRQPRRMQLRSEGSVEADRTATNMPGPSSVLLLALFLFFFLFFFLVPGPGETISFPTLKPSTWARWSPGPEKCLDRAIGRGCIWDPWNVIFSHNAVCQSLDNTFPLSLSLSLCASLRLSTCCSQLPHRLTAYSVLMPQRPPVV